ncbi:flagellar hook-length control protein FliK [Pseudochelatococcus contaminans]|uniref:Flagellar hook-length control protein-like C-terminal domain-containing protein n=1 Tax=Pseudochelatococcus contaminans TaxID=1538103 RepID=A0A7W5Z1J8_9HYPH|nr:flagellar hook-length control protein FliK [Pseudochelatococcus contaminans]MBB3808358.1 hypothetical protein [Pseudochelatococcus contaminans]
MSAIDITPTSGGAISSTTRGGAAATGDDGAFSLIYETVARDPDDRKAGSEKQADPDAPDEPRAMKNRIANARTRLESVVARQTLDEPEAADDIGGDTASTQPDEANATEEPSRKNMPEQQAEDRPEDNLTRLLGQSIGSTPEAQEPTQTRQSAPLRRDASPQMLAAQEAGAQAGQSQQTTRIVVIGRETHFAPVNVPARETAIPAIASIDAKAAAAQPLDEVLPPVRTATANVEATQSTATRPENRNTTAQATTTQSTTPVKPATPGAATVEHSTVAQAATAVEHSIAAQAATTHSVTRTKPVTPDATTVQASPFSDEADEPAGPDNAADNTRLGPMSGDDKQGSTERRPGTLAATRSLHGARDDTSTITQQSATTGTGAQGIVADASSADAGTLVRIANQIIAQARDLTTAATPAQQLAAQVANPAAENSGPVRILRIQLQPEELGLVTARMRIVGGVLELRLTADKAQSVEILQRDRDGLLDSLRRAGYTAEIASIEFSRHQPALQNGAPSNAGNNNGQPSAHGFNGQENGSAPGGFDRQRDQGEAGRSAGSRSDNEDTATINIDPTVQTPDEPQAIYL